MPDVMSFYHFIVDGGLRAQVRATDEETAWDRITWYWPRSQVEFVNATVDPDQSRHEASAPRRTEPLRPVSHHQPTRRPAKPKFKGGKADESTMEEIEQSVVDAYGEH